jgi:ribosomal protein S18 acetylase RimI-like enzyme
VPFIAYEDGILCGYVRCRDDDGIEVFVYDLLVRRSCRGRSIGRTLMEKICEDFPGPRSAVRIFLFKIESILLKLVTSCK